MDTQEPPDDDSVSSLTEEQVTPLLEKTQDEFRKIGLYLSGVIVQEDIRPDAELEPGEHRVHRLMVQFDLGEIAFSTRMTDPEAAGVDDTFREIAAADVEEQIEEIRRKYGKKKPE